MNIYITGGTGFIGSYIVREFADGKNNVVVLARNPDKVPALCSLPGVTVKKADMLDYDALEKSMTDMDALIHIALCWGDTGPEMILNETFSSVKIIDTAIKKGAKKIIFTSSTAAQGGIERDTDETAKLKPNDFYGATKGSVELFLSAYSSYYPTIQINTIRPGYTFGNPVIPGAYVEGDRRFKTICTNAKYDKPIEVTKYDGTQFIHAADLAKIYRSVIESELKNEVFYGLGSKFTSWEQIALWAVEFTGSKSEIKVTDKGWSPNPPFYMVKKIQKYFGFDFDSTEHLKEHVKYFISIL
jgi:UDP-glucose 4-epimerase